MLYPIITINETSEELKVTVTYPSKPVEHISHGFMALAALGITVLVFGMVTDENNWETSPLAWALLIFTTLPVSAGFYYSLSNYKVSETVYASPQRLKLAARNLLHTNKAEWTWEEMDISSLRFSGWDETGQKALKHHGKFFRGNISFYTQTEFVTFAEWVDSEDAEKIAKTIRSFAEKLNV